MKQAVAAVAARAWCSCCGTRMVLLLRHVHGAAVAARAWCCCCGTCMVLLLWHVQGAAVVARAWCCCSMVLLRDLDPRSRQFGLDLGFLP
jgi:hypothetical protein